jgi:hypothetical protein
MPVVSARDKSRLAALIAIVKPANSLAARLDTLSIDDRAYYESWKEYVHRWVSNAMRTADPDDREAHLYHLHLQGYGPASLRKDIRIALFGEIPCIPITATDDDALRVFLRECER